MNNLDFSYTFYKIIIKRYIQRKKYEIVRYCRIKVEKFINSFVTQK